jgi:alpha-methylacyl-CoA racemase
LSGLASCYFCDGEIPRRGQVDLRGGLICYASYPCTDGWVTIAAVEPKFWATFCNGIGRPDLIAHHMDPTGGWAQRELEHEFRRRTRDEWAAFSAEHDCCLEVVLPLDEALGHELVHAREMVVEIAQPGTDGVKVIGVPIRLSRTPGDVHREPAPSLGEHTAEVLAEAGFTAEQITELSMSGAIAGVPEGARAPTLRP